MVNIVHNHKNGKPRICIITTGGTAGSTKTEYGLTPTIPGGEYLKIPRVYEAAGNGDITVVEFSKKDSTLMGYWDRVRLARESLEARRDGYSGIVVIHGTDKMANTAAKLSFIYPFKDFPVVFTGARTPLEEKDSDLPDNLLGALQVAAGNGLRATGDLVYFDGWLLKGNRAVKMGAAHYFDSPTCSHIGENTPNPLHLGHRIKLTDGGRRMQEEYEQTVEAFPEFSVSDELFDFPPTATHEVRMIEVADETPLDINMAEGKKGVVVKAWGEGGFNDQEANVISEWCRQGKVVVVASRVPYLNVDLTKYAVGRAAIDAGAIGVNDMVPDTAYEKLKFAFGTGETNVEAIKRFMASNFVGEITPYAPESQRMSREELHGFLGKAIQKKKEIAAAAPKELNNHGQVYSTRCPDVPGFS